MTIYAIYGYDFVEIIYLELTQESHIYVSRMNHYSLDSQSSSPLMQLHRFCQPLGKRKNKEPITPVIRR